MTEARRAREIPQEHRRVSTRDGVSIAYTLWNADRPELLVIAPGFWRVRRGREILFLATHFARAGYAVAALDFRGHGESEGAYTFGASEPLDLAAVIQELAGCDRRFSRFSLLGFSLGGSIAIATLADFPELPCRALALVSSPTVAAAVRPKPWRTGAARQVSIRQILRMPRMAPRALFFPGTPASAAIAGLTMPKLIVTMERDWLVDPSHGSELARAAAAPVEHVHLEVPGGLHADALVRYRPLRAVRLLDRWFRRNAPP
jgi:pimeloyl-ACP methyl ester carboxylesterase